jgi:hypothetical protein
MLPVAEKSSRDDPILSRKSLISFGTRFTQHSNAIVDDRTRSTQNDYNDEGTSTEPAYTRDVWDFTHVGNARLG